ncbi:MULTISPECIES: hypothetical protein [unclassified Pseudoclavibacter]|uniref:hypothetical protein n=1 Tax=unclassified Pseudoclavibacter TaxID=2615177 RepID=UPI000CE7BCA1|nr:MULTISPECIES: hypothetical protein [unclassified Pseudoclavibacter]MBS3178259.1 hypothetical protein [Pseudoclavibacter sp. Marseille-Q4354]NYF13955.1 hypothetical protein [Pseudoclavibacter sp. JAI123]PPG29104.1 hypothetical protein C5B97_08695 [Pseudoclavibacter sp. RFBB5]
MNAETGMSDTSTSDTSTTTTTTLEELPGAGAAAPADGVAPAAGGFTMLGVAGTACEGDSCLI